MKTIVSASKNSNLTVTRQTPETLRKPTSSTETLVETSQRLHKDKMMPQKTERLRKESNRPAEISPMPADSTHLSALQTLDFHCLNSLLRFHRREPTT